MLRKPKKSELAPQESSLKTRKSDIQSYLDVETEKLRKVINSGIEPDVEAKYQTDLLEKAEKAEKERIEKENAEKEKAEQEAGTVEESANPAQPHLAGDDAPSTPEPPPEITEEEKQKQIEEEKNKIRKELVDSRIAEDDKIKSLKTDVENLEKEISTLSREIGDVDKEIKDLEDYINFDFGPDARFAYLNDQSYTYNAAEYVYTLEPFEKVTQGHVRVGNWVRWQSDYTELKFDNGERCWGGPDRSMIIKLSCGGDTQILEVTEPNKCEYSMAMKTPGACTKTALESLKNKIRKELVDSRIAEDDKNQIFKNRY